MTTPVGFDPKELESKVKAMYRSLTENPGGQFHFEMGEPWPSASAMRLPI